MTNKIEILKPRIGEGVYTIKDASIILNIPSPKLRAWVNAYWRKTFKDISNVKMSESYIWGESRETAFNFYTLIEIFTVMSLRNLGVTFKTIINARSELSEILKTKYPFASEKLMSDGRNIIYLLDDYKILELGTAGQTAFRKIIEPFCKNLDFDKHNELAFRFWPLGRSSSIVVDPKHGFGRPTILGTNISTDAIQNLILAGENKEDIANLYDLTVEQIEQVYEFSNRLAA
jgi:uncharacterized protein (DUF433 family)